jgi:hypothetical protein
MEAKTSFTHPIRVDWVVENLPADKPAVWHGVVRARLIIYAATRYSRVQRFQR